MRIRWIKFIESCVPCILFGICYTFNNYNSAAFTARHVENLELFLTLQTELCLNTSIKERFI